MHSISAALDAETAADTLNEQLDLKRVDSDDLYEAMDYLVERKSAINRRLAKRHLEDGSMALFTSSYVEGDRNEFAAYGYNRDRKKGKKQIVFGLTTQARLREDVTGLDWISGMRRSQIREAVEQEDVQLNLFHEQDLMEIESDHYPDERLILCRNPFQAEDGRRKREELLEKTEASLDEVVKAVSRDNRPLRGKDLIGLRVGRVCGRYKMKKYFKLDITEDKFSYSRDEAALESAEKTDGMYAIRTSLTEAPEASEVVTHYKRLAKVEAAFRTMKSVSLKVRPIHRRRKRRVIGHVFLCMLAYYVEFHLRKTLAPMLFAEDDPAGKATRRESVVKPVKRSPSAERKARTKRTATGGRAMSYASLMAHLSGLCRNIVRPKVTTDPAHQIQMMAKPTATQKQAFELLGLKTK